MLCGAAAYQERHVCREKPQQIVELAFYIRLIDRRGCIVMRVACPVNPTAEQELFQAIDRAIADRQGK